MRDNSSGPTQAKESVLKDEEIGASKALKGREKKSKEEIIKKRTNKELMDMKEIRDFWQEIFGKGAIANFFIEINAFISGEEGTFDEEAFDSEINERAKILAKKGFNMDEFIVAHRALGYGRHRENSEESLRSALESGEKQVEIDVRKGPDGKYYLSHAPIDKKNMKGLLPLKKAIEIFAESKNQNVAIFFDIKEVGTIKVLDKEMSRIDSNFSGRKGYRPLSKRHFVMTFDKTILREAKESNGTRPLIYYYYPSAKYGMLTNILSILGRKKLLGVLEEIDSIAGTRNAEGLKRNGLSINGKRVGKKFKTTFEIRKTLPDKEVLSAIRSSNGYLCVPAALATKELVKEIKKKGIKVAVWGANDERIKKMILKLGVDLVITDTPGKSS